MAGFSKAVAHALLPLCTSICGSKRATFGCAAPLGPGARSAAAEQRSIAFGWRYPAAAGS
uniref:Uncharacterized protein n=1 Tax=Oryza brachyantha TaxID=4533 RepID=J3MPD0_ORYBR